MQSGIDEIHASGGEVLAISVDTVEENADLVKQMGLDFPVLSDPELKAIDAYDLRHKNAVVQGKDVARPGVFIIDGEGIIRWRDLTENYRVRVRPQQVIEQLQVLE